MIDHIVIGAPELAMGINYVFDKTKFRAVLGGQHIQWNTENALLSLGEDIYLEVISPQPGRIASPPFETLSALRLPQTITWAAKTEDILGTANCLTHLHIRHSGVIDGSRLKKDGSQLNWKILFPENNFGGVFPFFIQWDRENMHPARGLVPGLILNQLWLYHNQAEFINECFKELQLDVSCIYSEDPHLKIELDGPSGKIEL
ncbi:MAG: VOC family protein [Saprospiraceae bacterium]|nr:VOC family protein [Saprospiraceae bacterium]